MHVSRRLVSISIRSIIKTTFPLDGEVPSPLAEQFINPCLFTPFPTAPLRVWPASTVRLVVGWSRLARSGKQLLRHQKPATADTRLPCLGQASLSILMQEQNWLVLMSLLSYFPFACFFESEPCLMCPATGDGRRDEVWEPNRLKSPSRRSHEMEVLVLGHPPLLLTFIHSPCLFFQTIFRGLPF